MKNKKYRNVAHSTIKVIASENIDISHDLNNNEHKSIAQLYEEENSKEENPTEENIEKNESEE